MPNVKTERVQIAAGGYYSLPLGGSFFHIVGASGPLDVEPDNGLPKREDARAGTKQSFGSERFTTLRLKNKNANAKVFVEIAVGDGDGADSSNSIQQAASTVNDGETIENLPAGGGDHVIAGVDSNGNQRKHFTVTVSAGVRGRVLIYNNRTGKLLAIIAGSDGASNGFREETDDDIKIVNYALNSVGAALDLKSTPAADANIAVSQVFYKNVL